MFYKWNFRNIRKTDSWKHRKLSYIPYFFLSSENRKPRTKKEISNLTLIVKTFSTYVQLYLNQEQQHLPLCTQCMVDVAFLECYDVSYFCLPNDVLEHLPKIRDIFSMKNFYLI